MNNILIIGASGGIGTEVIKKVLDLQSFNHIGLHYFSNVIEIDNTGKQNVNYFKEDLFLSTNVVKDYLDWAKSITHLVILSGGIIGNSHWKDIEESEWEKDLRLNLTAPFFLCREAIENMKENGGGKIVVVSTESASHGGGTYSLGYGAAKSGLDCVVKRLAKDCAEYNININCVKPGFIMTEAHKRWKDSSEEEIIKRIDMIPMKRAGKPEEVADLIMYLLSDKADFITGSFFSISGGDWL